MKEGRMRDPNERDRQQRDLTEELRHDAELRAARKRLEEAHQPPGTAPEEDTRPENHGQLFGGEQEVSGG